MESREIKEKMNELIIDEVQKFVGSPVNNENRKGTVSSHHRDGEGRSNLSNTLLSIQKKDKP
jgi:hypothetical protein